MFLGEFSHTVDDKGRLTLPAKFRPELEKGVVITRGVDRCLYVFTAAEFQLLAERISTLPMTNADSREFSRHFFSGASDVELDKQGRILIPQNLREYAGINGEVIVAGVNKRIEVWGTHAWDEIRARFASGGVINDPERLAKLGI